MKGKKYILLKAKIPVWLKYWAYLKGGVTPVLKNLYLGYSRQTQTTGANLQKYTVRSVNNVGIDYSCNAKGQVRMQGTATRNLGFAYNQVTDVMTLNAGTYKLKVIGNYEGLVFNRTDISRAISLDNNNEGIVVIDNDNTEFRILVYVSTNVTYNADFYITLTPGDTATEERYTGGIPAPNPNYPIEIENLIGNVPIQAGNKVITFPLAEGQKLYRNSMLTPNGIVNTDSELVLVGNENFIISSVSGNKKMFSLENIINAKIFSSSEISNIQMLSNNFIKGTGVVSTTDLYTFWYNTSGRSLRFVMEDTLSLEDFVLIVTTKYNNGIPIKVQYELRTAETVAYTEAQLQAYTNLCKYFEENTDLNNYIVEGG